MIDFLLRPEIAEQISRDTGYLTGVKASNDKFQNVAPLFHLKKIWTVLSGNLPLAIRQ